jgi:hypothetical protein
VGACFFFFAVQSFPAISEKPLTKKVEFMSVFVKAPKTVGPYLPGLKEVEIPVYANGEEWDAGHCLFLCDRRATGLARRTFLMDSLPDPYFWIIHCPRYKQYPDRLYRLLTWPG